jgi:UDP-sugar transporter A1/2/3
MERGVATPSGEGKESGAVVVKTAGGASAQSVDATAPAAAADGEKKSTVFLYVATALLITQTSVYFLMMQYTQSVGRATGLQYHGGVAVLIQEVLKMTISFAVHAWSVGSVAGAWGDVYAMLAETPRESLLLLVPGVLYVVQNNLLYFASSVISASETQILMQLKMLTTAIFSTLLLNKRFSWAQWGALTMLACGCALVEASSMDRESEEEATEELETLETSSSSAAGGGGGGAGGASLTAAEAASTAAATASPAEPTRVVEAPAGGHGHARVLSEAAASTPAFFGVAAALTASTTSGLAGVSIERLLKSKGSMWVRNTHLAFWSVLIALVVLVSQERGRSALAGGVPTLLHGFTPYVWFTVLLGSAGGILVAVVLKYLDSIVKNFAAAASIVLCAVINVSLSTAPVDPTFVLGTLLVVVAVVVYQYAPPPPPPSAAATAADAAEKKLQQTQPQAPAIEVTK